MPDVNPQSLDGYAETPIQPAVLHSVPRRLGRIASTPLLIAAAVGILLLAGGAFAYWGLAHQASPWFVDTPLHTARTVTIGDRTRKTLSTLLYAANGKYSATNTVYEYGKPPAEERYAGSWRQDKEWVCLRMDWMPDKEFCNTFVKTDQGWLLVNRTNAQTTPVSLAALAAPSEAELTPPASPASCTFAGQPVAHSSSVPAFETPVVPSGQPCNAEVRTCTNGQLSGSYQNARCSAAIALPTTPQKPAARPPTPSATPPAKAPK